MKKFFLIILAGFTGLMLSSCVDMLNTSPGDQVASSEMWTTKALVEQGVNGLYQSFYAKDLSIYNSASNEDVGYPYHLLMGLESQSFETTAYAALSSATKTATDPWIKYCWQWGYTAIHRINDALANLHRADDVTDEEYEAYECEIRFLRAFFYTFLNKIFQGVPLYLEPITESECTQGQATSTEVWNAVLDDLDFCLASSQFPDNTISSNHGRPSKGAAYSLRGQVYMWLAWENGEDTSYYQKAADDFEKVSGCGYGLWEGEYIDFFDWNNETDKEMIFPLQFGEDVGYCDILQMVLAGRDSYHGWSYIRPAATFVDMYQNEDGTEFNWTDVIPEWNDDVFVNDLKAREVFFIRDSISLDSNGSVIADYWSTDQAGQIQERINRMGTEVFNKYYLKDGNEARLRSAYENRDPRLKQTVLTPYEPFDTYGPDYLSVDMIGKEVRWPFLLDAHADGKDYYCGNEGEHMFLYRKYVYHLKGEIPGRDQCPTDWPLIRYTDTYLRLAECYVHLNKLSDAVSIVNEIRTRAHMPNVSVGTADEVMEAVKYERRVELCLEGHDWFDEWRWGDYKKQKFQGNDQFGTTALWGEWEGVLQRWYYTDNMYPWSAPAEECDRNSNLTRRDGWSY